MRDLCDAQQVQPQVTRPEQDLWTDAKPSKILFAFAVRRLVNRQRPNNIVNNKLPHWPRSKLNRMKFQQNADMHRLRFVDVNELTDLVLNCVELKFTIFVDQRNIFAFSPFSFRFIWVRVDLSYLLFFFFIHPVGTNGMRR